MRSISASQPGDDGGAVGIGQGNLGRALLPGVLDPSGSPAHSPTLQAVQVILHLRYVDVLQFRTLLRLHHHPLPGIEVVDLDAIEGQLRPPAGAAAVARLVDELAGRYVLGVVLHADLAVVEPEFAVAEEEVG